MTSTQTGIQPHHETPLPKIPDHVAKAAEPKPMTKEEKIDRQMKDTFPASDPPSFSGGNHIIGAPKGRESEPVTADSPEVKDAEQKVKSGDAPKPDTY